MGGGEKGGTASFAVGTAGVGTNWAALGGVGGEVRGFALAAGPDVGHVDGYEIRYSNGEVLG
jgi:hypothetical protein